MMTATEFDDLLKRYFAPRLLEYWKNDTWIPLDEDEPDRLLETCREAEIAHECFNVG